jgi:hypothetical protein
MWDTQPARDIEGHAARAERLWPIHHMKMQMRLGRIARIAEASQNLPLHHDITDVDAKAARDQMGVQRIPAISEIFHDVIAR